MQTEFLSLEALESSYKLTIFEHDSNTQMSSDVECDVEIYDISQLRNM